MDIQPIPWLVSAQVVTGGSHYLPSPWRALVDFMSTGGSTVGLRLIEDLPAGNLTICGGSWLHDADNYCLASHYMISTDSWSVILGFRLLEDL